MTWDRVILGWRLMRFVTRNRKLFKSVYRIRIPRSSGLLQVHPSLIQWKILCLFVHFLGNWQEPLFRGWPIKIKDIYILRRTKDDLAKINERLRLPNLSTLRMLSLICSQMRGQLYEFVFHDAQATIQRSFQECSQSLNSKNMVILECLLRARQCHGVGLKCISMGLPKRLEPQADRMGWEGPSNKMETLFRMIQLPP